MTDHLSWEADAAMKVDLEEAKDIMIAKMYEAGRMVELPDNRHEPTKWTFILLKNIAFDWFSRAKDMYKEKSRICIRRGILLVIL